MGTIRWEGFGERQMKSTTRSTVKRQVAEARKMSKRAASRTSSTVKREAHKAAKAAKIRAHKTSRATRRKLGG